MMATAVLVSLLLECVPARDKVGALQRSAASPSSSSSSSQRRLPSSRNGVANIELWSKIRAKQVLINLADAGDETAGRERLAKLRNAPSITGIDDIPVLPQTLEAMAAMQHCGPRSVQGGAGGARGERRRGGALAAGKVTRRWRTMRCARLPRASDARRRRRRSPPNGRRSSTAAASSCEATLLASEAVGRAATTRAARGRCATGTAMQALAQQWDVGAVERLLAERVQASCASTRRRRRASGAAPQHGRPCQ